MPKIPKCSFLQVLLNLLSSYHWYALRKPIKCPWMLRKLNQNSPRIDNSRTLWKINVRSRIVKKDSCYVDRFLKISREASRAYCAFWYQSQRKNQFFPDFPRIQSSKSIENSKMKGVFTLILTLGSSVQPRFSRCA